MKNLPVMSLSMKGMVNKAYVEIQILNDSNKRSIWTAINGEGISQSCQGGNNLIDFLWYSLLKCTNQTPVPW